MQPYVQNQTGYMLGGILADMGARIEERNERRKQDVQRVKAAEAFLKSLPDDVRGLQPEDLAMMSGPDKLAAMVGIIESQKAKAQDAQLKQFTAQQIAGEEEGRRREMFNQNLLGRLAPFGQPKGPQMEDFYENATDESQRPQRTVPPQVALLEEAARAGLLDPTRINPEAFLKDMQPEAALTPDKFEFTDVPGTDYKAWRLGRSAGTIPKSGGTVRQATDEQGNPIPDVYTGPKGNVFQRSTRPEAGKITSRDRWLAINREIQALSPLASVGNNAQVIAQLKSERDAIERAGIEDPPQAAKAPAVGAVEDGYRFKGGDPADPANWEKVR